MTKDFPTLAVLSVTSGRLITQPKDVNEGNGIGQMYEVLGWMTDDSPFTHQLGRFAEECKPWIHRWHPEITGADAEIVRRCEAGEVKEVQRDMLELFGETIQLQKIPRDDHDVKNPIEELLEMKFGGNPSPHS